ncbi:25S rRNA (adenine(2142)-N(1))-methyltransferase, Bmt2,Methyltransferase type 11,S-adenosyl-L-methionine- [Cinara cedri]|uniref:S-adenosylmethionine sensor upstream of mTORC1 n=1 Tax=Cinara cedri TaxID=506608 RepID=A0A5E4MPF7_9HEMI|nr:25S rRNA (adenine(2142)-N(1))-methyltransferase, Bmt2,Methyltransferase type 11,S-adenosyl-L-methionine- [Cinara cedri]
MSFIVRKKGKKCTRKSISNEHIQHSEFIKKCHQKLRLNSLAIGAEEAWRNHCSDDSLLKNYSCSMHKLASQFWDTNNKNEPSSCRILWITNNICTYFQDNYLYEINREKSLAKKFNVNWDMNIITNTPKNPFYLLDVGSCYNPFQKYTQFKVLPIDLAPAVESVVKCDFLSVPLDTKLNIFENDCQTLPLSNFDAVIFSLFLEYFPLPQQRYKCCEKAYNVLKPGGLLVIATPDSSHASYNSKLMKNWKISLGCLGFWRIKYEKLIHLHCMVFRKCLLKQIPKNWFDSLNNTNNVEDLITIPQDLRNHKINNETLKIIEQRDDDMVANLFSELINI